MCSLPTTTRLYPTVLWAALVRLFRVYSRHEEELEPVAAVFRVRTVGSAASRCGLTPVACPCGWRVALCGGSGKSAGAAAQGRYVRLWESFPVLMAQCVCYCLSSAEHKFIWHAAFTGARTGRYSLQVQQVGLECGVCTHCVHKSTTCVALAQRVETVLFQPLYLSKGLKGGWCPVGCCGARPVGVAIFC